VLRKRTIRCFIDQLDKAILNSIRCFRGSQCNCAPNKSCGWEPSADVLNSGIQDDQIIANWSSPNEMQQMHGPGVWLHNAEKRPYLPNIIKASRGITACFVDVFVHWHFVLTSNQAQRFLTLSGEPSLKKEMSTFLNRCLRVPITMNSVSLLLNLSLSVISQARTSAIAALKHKRHDDLSLPMMKVEKINTTAYRLHSLVYLVDASSLTWRLVRCKARIELGPKS